MRICQMDSPILTMRMPSSHSRNLRATETFSSFWERKVGFLLCLGNFLPDRTSIKAINFSPSDRSVSKLAMYLSTVLRCSLAQRVKVFCWMRFHWASSARSRSVATISSLSLSFACPPPSAPARYEAGELTTWSAGLPLAQLTPSVIWLMVSTSSRGAGSDTGETGCLLFRSDTVAFNYLIATCWLGLQPETTTTKLHAVTWHIFYTQSLCVSYTFDGCCYNVSVNCQSLLCVIRPNWSIDHNFGAGADCGHWDVDRIAWPMCYATVCSPSMAQWGEFQRKRTTKQKKNTRHVGICCVFFLICKFSRRPSSAWRMRTHSISTVATLVSGLRRAL